ncbi:MULTISPECIES: hypothetical protein [unclassified Isoptericola]|uniref:hypothetical protein n=1 Tax=unclassified Isoptericola TaxID=2623355 RepID=UPI002712E9EC|nr:MULTISPECIES: hypothetical protein [unclassified Isoptericola]MDO8149458.1 hypothetical protein [Isoptericola sp. b515]MDO8152405.1 hypothetical protein [Isoptericola sp. b408]
MMLTATAPRPTVVDRVGGRVARLLVDAGTHLGDTLTARAEHRASRAKHRDAHARDRRARGRHQHLAVERTRDNTAQINPLGLR